MVYKKVFFDCDLTSAYLKTYVFPCRDIAPKDAILIIPGGGYGHVSLEREGEAIAVAYAAKGLSAFVLNYTVPPKNEDAPLLEAAAAFAYIKKHAKEYSINPDRIFVIGFSAGGHLAGTLSTKYAEAEKTLGFSEGFLRPAGTIYGYPVVTAMCETHVGSYENLTGIAYDEIDEEKKRKFSNELNVTSDTPPAFIWHTATDESVPPIGSLRLAESYIRAGVKVEMHLYPEGPHGTALCVNHTSAGMESYIIPKAAKWLDESFEWMQLIH
jgi:acetyl esterase/lipase